MKLTEKTINHEAMESFTNSDIEHVISNDELQSLIIDFHAMIRKSAPASTLQTTLQTHLQSLLDIQLLRAGSIAAVKG